MSRLSGFVHEQTWNPANAAANVSNGHDLSVPGARPGDFVLISFDAVTAADCDNMVLDAHVTANDQVTVIVHADSTGSDLGSGTLRIKVIPLDAI